MIEINLLQERRRLVSKKTQQASSVNRVAVLLTIVTALITLATVGYSVYLSSNLKQVQNQIAVQNGKIKSLEPVAIETLKVMKRLDAVGEIIGERDLFRNKLDVFFSLVTSNSLDLSSTDFGKKGQLEIVGKTDNIARYMSFNDWILAQTDNFGISNISTSSISRSEKGEYNINYLLTF